MNGRRRLTVTSVEVEGAQDNRAVRAHRGCDVDGGLQMPGLSYYYYRSTNAVDLWTLHPKVPATYPFSYTPESVPRVLPCSLRVARLARLFGFRLVPISGIFSVFSRGRDARIFVCRPTEVLPLKHPPLIRPQQHWKYFVQIDEMYNYCFGTFVITLFNILS